MGITSDLKAIADGGSIHHMVASRAAEIRRLHDAGEFSAAEALAIEIDTIQIAAHERSRLNPHPMYHHPVATGTHTLPLRWWAETAIHATSLSRHFSQSGLDDSPVETARRCLGLPVTLDVTERSIAAIAAE